MTVKKGKVKITNGTMDGTSQGIETVMILNIVEKTDGSYVETLSELVSKISRLTDGGVIYEVDNASEVGEGYRVFPNTTSTDRINNAKISSNDVVEWIEALTTI